MSEYLCRWVEIKQGTFYALAKDFTEAEGTIALGHGARCKLQGDGPD